LYPILIGASGMIASIIGTLTIGSRNNTDVVLRAEPDWNNLPASLHPRLRMLLERCLDKEARDRLSGISDARVDIQKALADPSGVLVQLTGEVVQAAQQSKLLWVAVVLGIVVAGVAGWNLKPTKPQPLTARFYHELPDGQEFTRFGHPLVTVSPDGSKIVYVANDQLYLRKLGEMAPRPIQGTDESPENPFFSPDGEWVGYVSVSDRQLKKIATIGGAPVTLCDVTAPFGASWGSDDTIVYGQSEGIMRVSANGGAPELVVPTEASEQVHGPQMLPGGEWVLFTLASVGGAARWDEAQIVAQSLESGERKVLWENGSDARYVPTGHLLYALEDVLFALPFDLASLEVSGGPVPIVEGVRRAVVPSSNTASANYGFSDRGTLIYVPGSAVGVNNILALADRTGGVEPLDVPPMAYMSPRLSPDGSRLAVETSNEGGSNIWIYDVSGPTQIRQLTQGGRNERPIWTPDGERVTFGSDRDGTMSIYLQPADGSGDAERLTTAEEGIEHEPNSWSPDGRTLSFARLDTSTMRGIWTLAPDGETEPEPFYDLSDSNQSRAMFSPNGNWLAYWSTESGTNEVYVQPFPAVPGVRHRITQNTGAMPLWSPDGSELFYRPSPNPTVPVLNVVGIGTEPAFSFTSERQLPVQGFLTFGSRRDYDIEPSGERFVMVFPADLDNLEEAARPQINIVLNWFEELKERVPVP